MRLGGVVHAVRGRRGAVVQGAGSEVVIVRNTTKDKGASITLREVTCLLCRSERGLGSSGVLVLSPGKIFSSCVSRVLPRLKRRGVGRVDFSLFTCGRLESAISSYRSHCSRVRHEVHFPRGTSLTRRGRSVRFVGLVRHCLIRLRSQLVGFGSIRCGKFMGGRSRVVRLFCFGFRSFPLLSEVSTITSCFVSRIRALQSHSLTSSRGSLVHRGFVGLCIAKSLCIVCDRFLGRGKCGKLPHISCRGEGLGCRSICPILCLGCHLRDRRKEDGVGRLIMSRVRSCSELRCRVLREVFSYEVAVLNSQTRAVSSGRRSILGFLPGVFKESVRGVVVGGDCHGAVRVTSCTGRLTNVRSVRLFRHRNTLIRRGVFTSVDRTTRRVTRALGLNRRRCRATTIILHARGRTRRV